MHMIRVAKTLVALLSILLAVTGCKFFEVQSEYRNANQGFLAVRTKATRGIQAPTAANAARLPFSDWSAPIY